MPSDRVFSLAELSALADVPVRTIRYYIGQGLLPAPGREGPGTRYGEPVLARLRLIRRFRDRHLPLSEIRAQLGALTDEEAIELAGTVEPAPAGDALEYVRSLLAADGGASARIADRGTPSLLKRVDAVAAPASSAAPVDRQVGLVAGLAGIGAPSAIEPPAPMLPPASPKPAAPERSQWERIVLEPDVELHVRRPLSRPQNRRVERLLAFARELMEGDAR